MWKISPTISLITIWTLLFVAPILAENKTPNDRPPDYTTKLMIIKQFGNEWRIRKADITSINETERWLKVKYRETDNGNVIRREVNKLLVVYGSFSMEELEINSWNP